MEIRVLEKKPNVLKIEIVGEGHTFCNLLESIILEDEEVEFTGYDISHPLVSNPVITLRTKGKEKPEDAFKKATEKILQKGREIRKEFNKALETNGKSTN